MRNYRGLVRSVARRISSAADITVRDLERGEIQQEPSMTDRLLGGIRNAIDGYRSKGVTWRAITLTDRGRGAQETEYGADFAGVLSVDLPDFKVDKGFLAQAKLIRNGGMGMSEFHRMVNQCEQMLRLSSASFVFLYTAAGIRIVPAISVVGASNPDFVLDTSTLYSRSLSKFYEDHLECFLGDRNINEATPAMLERLDSESLLYIAARQSEQV